MRITILVLTLCVSVSCAAQMNAEFRQKALTKASFDLDCAPEKLQISVLNTVPNGRETQLGIKGCSKQGSYSLVNDMNWVRDD